MIIRKLNTDRRRDVSQFVTFPFELYRDCPQWVPPLVSEIRGVLDRNQHPFYHHSEADFFVAQGEGQTMGRIAVMENRNYNDYLGTRTASFGFFDVVDDRQVAQALLEAAFDWARRRGLDAIMGPRTLNGMHSYGVLVEGFEHRAALGIPYNYAYYDSFLRAAGFEKDDDHLSGVLKKGQELSDRFFRLAERVKQKRGLWVKTFRSSGEMRRWIPRVQDVYRQAFAQVHTYYPPTDHEFAETANSLIAMADPRLIKLVMKGDDVIGFLFAYHDVSAGLQRARGKLWPLGWVHLLREKRRTRWINFNGIGVLPPFQGRGASILLYTELAKTLAAFDFDFAEVVQVREENVHSRSDMETIGVEWYKRHRNYRRDL